MRCLALAVLVLAACGKSEAPKKQVDEHEAYVHEDDPKEPIVKPVTLPAAGTAPPTVAATDLADVWETPLVTLDGKPATLDDFDGKALLLVNVASECGNTPQYAGLEALQDKYGKDGFTVVGFPCNQFGGQEPGTAEEIQQFCSTTYGVTFPLTEKIEVNGPGRHPIYQALTPLKDPTGRSGDIQWNFEKFVVSADGTQVTRFAHKTKPDDPTVIAAIEAALPKK
jgi:glutathione peroxidase